MVAGVPSVAFTLHWAFVRCCYQRSFSRFVRPRRLRSLAVKALAWSHHAAPCRASDHASAPSPCSRNFCKIWYCEPDCQLSSGLRELMSDGATMRMGRLLVSQTVKHCSVYVVNGYRKGNSVEICSNDKDYVPTEAEYNESGFVEVEVECESEASSEEDRFDDSADDGDHKDHFGFDVEDENDGGVENVFGGFDGPLNEHDNAQTTGFDATMNDTAVRDDVEVGEIFKGYETEDIDSYEGDLDDMIKKRIYPKYNEAEMSREYVFKVGLEFKSLGQFKDAIREHALLNGRDIRYIKNDKVRCRVGCREKKGKCRWIAFASKVGSSDCFRLKTLNGKHTCGRDYSGRLASSSWVSQKIVTNISRGEEMKIATVIQTIQDKCTANISVTKAYWARRKASKERSQYGHNRRHCPNPIVSGKEEGAGEGVEEGGRATSSQPLPTTPASFQQLPATLAVTASTQPPPILATSAFQAPTTSIGAVAPTTATSQQALPLEGPASQSLLAVASTKSHQAPRASSQPLPKTKVFGVRRSGRLKLGVMKQKGAPSLHIDLSDE
ncbi:hypothetical protein Ahy_A03g015779 [Arachis hypogaea]|uniref:Transposase MuDR plant domain-containing protein n=1 Tax=Arachis hypogaea TaxID=3818 RepID=A0A445E181_ARAHY|nr:hypothetical protein Ahy_A03g015779 [Arachis hypogaea]